MAIPSVTFTSIKYNDIFNTFDDFGLILSSQEIGLPTVKTNYIELQGRNGSLDMTESLGSIYYNDRILTFTFSIVSTIYSWDEIRTEVAKRLHGGTFLIQVYSDLDYYYQGRVEIDSYQSSRGLGTIVLKCTCEPFKYGALNTRSIPAGGLATIEIKQGYYNTIEYEFLSQTENVEIKIDDNFRFIKPGFKYEISLEEGEHTFENPNADGVLTIQFQDRFI